MFSKVGKTLLDAKLKLKNLKYFLCPSTNDLAYLDQGSLNCSRPQKYQNWYNSTFSSSQNIHENSLDIKCGVEDVGILLLDISMPMIWGIWV